MIVLPDLSKCTKLLSLNCSYNKLKELPDLSKCVNLEYLICVENKLLELPNLSECKNLFYLDCKENQIKNLYVSIIQCKDLEEYIKYNNYYNLEELNNLLNCKIKYYYYSSIMKYYNKCYL